MKIYIFIYNVVTLKAEVSRLKADNEYHKFVLIGSSYALKNLSVANHNCFDDIHQISRNFHQVDYEQVKQIVEQYVASHGAHNVLLLSNEDSTQLVCGQLRERYGIAGDKVDYLLPFVNKVVSKRRLAGVVKTPKFVEFDKAQYQSRRESYLLDITNQLDFPLFTKPIDLVSKFEVHKVNGFSDLQAAAEQLVQSPYEFEIDEFITGELFHCDVVMNHGNIVFTMIAQYAFPLARFSEGKPIGSIPVAEQRLLTMLNEFATKVITQLGCQHGTYHLKVYLESKSQELVFLEISARTAGILIPRFYEIQFGIHLEELHYLVHMGKLDENFSIKSATQFAGWVAYPKLPGIIANIKEPPIEVGYQFDKLLQTGDITHNIDSLLDAACNVVFWDESLQKIQRAFEVLKQFQPLEFTDLEQSAIQQLAVPCRAQC